MKKIWDNYKELIISAIVWLLLTPALLIIEYKIGYNRGLEHRQIIYTPPVEKKVIDTLYVTRDKIITKVKYLEVVKHDTIEKVYNLDDTSTLKLFYKLVSE